MTNGEVLDLMYEVFVLAVQLGGPVLVISMLVGVLISIIQAATQIHEQTITFVPKLLVIGIILVFTGGNMLETLQDFTVRIIESDFRKKKYPDAGKGWIHFYFDSYGIFFFDR